MELKHLFVNFKIISNKYAARVFFVKNVLFWSGKEKKRTVIVKRSVNSVFI